jgi:hypothetical protein
MKPFCFNAKISYLGQVGCSNNCLQILCQSNNAFRLSNITPLGLKYREDPITGIIKILGFPCQSIKSASNLITSLMIFVYDVSITWDEIHQHKNSDFDWHFTVKSNSQLDDKMIIVKLGES